MFGPLRRTWCRQRLSRLPLSVCLCLPRSWLTVDDESFHCTNVCRHESRCRRSHGGESASRSGRQDDRRGRLQSSSTAAAAAGCCGGCVTGRCGCSGAGCGTGVQATHGWRSRHSCSHGAHDRASAGGAHGWVGVSEVSEENKKKKKNGARTNKKTNRPMIGLDRQLLSLFRSPTG